MATPFRFHFNAGHSLSYALPPSPTLYYPLWHAQQTEIVQIGHATKIYLGKIEVLHLWIIGTWNKSFSKKENKIS